MLPLSDPGASRVCGSARLRIKLALIEEQDSCPFELTDEQLAEVRRRRADNPSKLLALEEFDARPSRSCL